MCVRRIWRAPAVLPSLRMQWSKFRSCTHVAVRAMWCVMLSATSTWMCRQTCPLRHLSRLSQEHRSPRLLALTHSFGASERPLHPSSSRKGCPVKSSAPERSAFRSPHLNATGCLSQILRRHRRLCRIPFAQRDERSGPARSLKVAGSALFSPIRRFSPMARWPSLAVMWPVIRLKLRVQASSAAGVSSRCWRVTVCRPGRGWLGSVVWWSRPENRQRPAAAAACIGRMKAARRLVIWSETGCASVLCRVIA